MNYFSSKFYQKSSKIHSKVVQNLSRIHKKILRIFDERKLVLELLRIVKVNVTVTMKKFQNTSLAAPGALANRLQCRTAHQANEANLDPPKSKIRDYFSIVMWPFYGTFAK